MQKIFYLLILALTIAACNEKLPLDRYANVESVVIKSDCAKVEKLPDDIETQMCYYDTSSIELAYEQVINEFDDVAIKDKLQKELPLHNLEYNSDQNQLWIFYKWPSKNEALLTITSEGEETEYSFKIIQDKIQVIRTRAIQ
jgi:hypothetical protein